MVTCCVCMLVFKVPHQLTNLTLHIDILLPCCGLWGRSPRNKNVHTISGDPAAKIYYRQEVELETNICKVWSFINTEEAPTRAFSWLKVLTGIFTFKTLLRHGQPMVSRHEIKRVDDSTIMDKRHYAKAKQHRQCTALHLNWAHAAFNKAIIIWFEGAAYINTITRWLFEYNHHTFSSKKIFYDLIWCSFLWVVCFTY